MRAGAIVAYSAGPARLARVLAVHGARLTLQDLDTGRTITRALAACWPILDAL